MTYVATVLPRALSLFVLAVTSAACSSSSDAPVETPKDSGQETTVTDTGNDGTGADTNDAAVAVPHGVLVVGTLAAADLATAQSQHDPLAKGGEPQAKAAGDVGHAVMLGTSLLGTKKDEFLALDRWTDGSKLDAFYGNPDFAKAFGALFSAPPSRGIYVLAPTWKGWGTPDSGNDADPHFWIVVRGTLKDTDLAKNQATHDAIVTGAESASKAAGDFAHVVYIGRDDKRQFLAIDVWKDSTNIEKFYTNPDLVKGFGTLFEGAPTIGVYQSTKWYQW